MASDMEDDVAATHAFNEYLHIAEFAPYRLRARAPNGAFRGLAAGKSASLNPTLFHADDERPANKARTACYESLLHATPIALLYVLYSDDIGRRKVGILGTEHDRKGR
jgi:hypothetical protein